MSWASVLWLACLNQLFTALAFELQLCCILS